MSAATAQPTPLRPPRSLTEEYVAGGAGDSGPWFAATARSWPHWIDDLTRDYGDDLYTKLLNDAVIAMAVDTLKAAILEDGVVLAPAVAEPGAPGFALAQEIHASAARMFEALDPALDDALDDMLGALAFGNRVAEKRYALRRDGGATRLMLAALKPKPRANLAFVVDPFMDVLGFLAVEPGQPSTWLTERPLDPAQLPANFLPRAKFAVLTHRPQDGDPRGTSLLRPAYTAWNMKRQALQEYLKYLVQFAVPSLIGTTGPMAGYEPILDGAGQPTGQTQSAQQALLSQLQKFRNATALVVPHGTEVKELWSQGDGAAFVAAFAMFKTEMMLAILGQTLATSEGEHNARAAAQVHQDALDTGVRRRKGWVARMIRRDLLLPWVALNWGEAALPLVPVAALGTTEEEDVTPRMTAVAGLEKAGWFTPSQRPAVDTMLHLPQRTPEETALEVERHQAPPVAPSPGGGDGGDPAGGDDAAGAAVERADGGGGGR